ncbi:hypothetical protein B0H14DRAFT_3137543 [Mycena olivaceomarginata]|nr:hypothetical protein B0H14DRAFT_3137543 [Mycena olivaceomarginata]
MSSSESSIWLDCEGEDEDFIEIVESIQPIRESVLHDFADLRNAPSVSFPGLRYRDYRYSPIKKANCEGGTPDDYALALALQKQWEEEDGVAQKRAAEDEERSQQLIARLQAMDEKMDKKRRIAPPKTTEGRSRQRRPEDGIVFKVVVDADGNTLEGDPDPDNVAQSENFRRLSQLFMLTSGIFSLELVKRVFEGPGPDMIGIGTRRLKVKTVTWFVNVQLEARFEAAKELLASLGIDNSETNLFHGMAANNIQPILEGGFLIPGVSSGGKMANGKTEGYGIYLAPTASASLGYARGINKMFMCRVVTGRVSNEIGHAKPRPLGQNGYESWLWYGRKRRPFLRR